MTATNTIPRPHFTDDDISQMVQAVIDDDHEAKSIHDSLAMSLKEVTGGQVGRIPTKLLNRVDRYRTATLFYAVFSTLYSVNNKD